MALDAPYTRVLLCCKAGLVRHTNVQLFSRILSEFRECGAMACTSRYCAMDSKERYFKSSVNHCT